MMDIYAEAVALHRSLQGKIEVGAKQAITDQKALSLLYSPGVAQPCLDIQKEPALAYTYTAKANTIAVITDGTAVLGLGNIGPLAAIPVMEGKAALFKSFAGVNAFPLCLDTTDTEKIIETVRLIAPMFGGINLEDIAAPRCFEIEARLQKELDIPVFHDDQHGTAIVCCAALQNALTLAGEPISSARIVINGAGSAGLAIAQLLAVIGAKNIAICDKAGCVFDEALPPDGSLVPLVRQRLQNGTTFGSLGQAVEGANVFIGVSAAGALSQSMVRSMAQRPIVFAMANPQPEIMPEEAFEAGAFIVSTGRSDYANQVNNVLAFPGIFKGALAVRARQINTPMKLAAMKAIGGCVPMESLRPNHIIPSPFDKSVVPAVAKSVARAAVESGVASIPFPTEWEA